MYLTVGPSIPALDWDSKCFAPAATSDRSEFVGRWRGVVRDTLSVEKRPHGAGAEREVDVLWDVAGRARKTLASSFATATPTTLPLGVLLQDRHQQLSHSRSLILAVAKCGATHRPP